ncbi:MAG: aminotransferase class IV [Bacteroidales bacterium]|nr:aminotransferase class IV [Bacteroidales bacterium]
MSKICTFIIHNGKLKRHTEISFPLYHRHVRFADGFFETMRSFAIYVPLYEFHYQRIQNAFNILKINKNNFPNKDELLNDIQRLIKSNKTFGSCRVRLTIYRSGQGMYASDSNDPDWYIETIPLEETNFVATKGLLVDIFHEQQKPISQVYSIKNNHATFYILASQWAKLHGYHDALLTNSSNNIVEATSSNLFVLINNVLYTPPLSDGPVDGVMRKFLLQFLPSELNVSIQQKNITAELLLSAQEILLTNAILGCQSVLGFKERRYYRNLSMEIIQFLNKKLVDDFK